MIVDDSKIIRIMLKEFFENNNFLVVAEANNGFEAYQKYKLFKPDFIIMDLQMPILNGIEALAKIKKIDTKVNIIMISAYGNKKNVIDAMTNGANGFVLKPLNDYKLKKIVQVFDFYKKICIL